LNQAKEEIAEFTAKGNCFFPEEVLFAKALSKVYHNENAARPEEKLPPVDRETIKSVINSAKNGWLSPEEVQKLLDAAAIKRVEEIVAKTPKEALDKVRSVQFPIVMKVVGPVHKSDVGGVVLNIENQDEMLKEFERMIRIKDTTAILMQPMLKGSELYAGAKYEDKFGHMVLAGMGGIYIEVFKDVSSVLSPVGFEEASEMIKSLKSYKLIEGTRGQEGVDQTKFAEIIVKLSALVEAAPEIAETDLNPLLGTANEVIAVDARIRIEK
jgi:acetyltransferase